MTNQEAPDRRIIAYLTMVPGGILEKIVKWKIWSKYQENKQQNEESGDVENE